MSQRDGLTIEEREALMRAAREIQHRAHAPYSHFFVGAAVRAASGRVYLGVNVENASYPVGMCAERAAIGAAITAGERELVAVAVATDAPRAVFPCGMCAQALHEHGPGLLVLAQGADGLVREATLDKILPYAYSGEGLAEVAAAAGAAGPAAGALRPGARE